MKLVGNFIFYAARGNIIQSSAKIYILMYTYQYIYPYRGI